MSTADPTRTDVCPVYIYMNHGTYCSWYALRCPGCSSPVSADGSCSLKAGCPQSPCPLRREPRGREGAEHCFCPELKQHGMKGQYPNLPPEEQCRPGAQILDPEQDVVIRYVRFSNPKPAGGSVDARVCWVRVTPRHFADSGFGPGATPEYIAHVKRQPGFERGIGYQVPPRPDSEIDRSQQDQEVVVLAPHPDDECLTILVHIKGNRWYEYHIALLGKAGAVSGHFTPGIRD